MRNLKFLLIAVYLLLFYLFSIVTVTTGYFVSSIFIIQHAAIISIILLLFSPLFLTKLLKVSIREAIVPMLFAAGIYVVGFFLAAFVFDVTTDGQTYHLQTIAVLSQGWNPVKELLDSNGPNNIYIQHYGKAFEYAAYTIYSLTGNAEGGKVFSIVLIISNILLLNYLIAAFNINIRPFFKHTLIVLLACNPITVYQLFSYYVDGQLSSCFLLLIIGIVCFVHNKKYGMLILLPAIAIMCNLKFTGLVYCILILSFAGLCCLIYYRKLFRSFLVSSLGFLLLSILIIGYNPYVRNTFENGHPFYPLAGKNHLDILSNVAAPTSFLHKGRMEKLAIATMARSNNMHGLAIVPEPILKFPFTFQLKEWTVFKSHDVRMGGMGPLWSGILLLNLVAFVCLVVTFRKKKQILYPYLLLSFFLIANVIINPEGWYIRYTPQIWLLPCISVFFLTFAKEKPFRYLQSVLVSVMFLNLAGTAIVSISADVIITHEIKSELSWIKNQKVPVSVNFNTFISNKFRMEECGVTFKEVPAKDTSLFLSGYKNLQIPNSSTIIYYPDHVPDYVPTQLFAFLSNYVKSDKHGK